MRQTQNPYGGARTTNRMFLILCIVMLLVLVAVTCDRLHAQTTKRIRDYASCSALSSNDYILIDSFTPAISCKATTAQLGVFLTVGTYAPVDAKYIIAGTNSTLTAEVDLATVVMRGPIGSRPAASIAGRLYFATDVGAEALSRDTGSAWIDVTLQPAVHGAAYHTGQIFPTADTGQKINGGYIDFSSASLAGNPTTGVRRQEVDPGTGELSIKNSIGAFISLENHVPLPYTEGGTGLTTATDDTVLVGTGSARAEKILPNCTDTSGQHINYTASTNAFSCGTSSSVSSPNSFATIAPTSGTSPVASSATDTLNLAAGSGITVTGNSGTKTITVAVVNPLNQNTSGTAAAFAANGANCSAGSFPLGVDATGASESCTVLPTSITGTANQIAASAATGGITLSIPTNPTLPGITTGIFNGNLTGNVTGNVIGSATSLSTTFSVPKAVNQGSATFSTTPLLDNALFVTLPTGRYRFEAMLNVGAGLTTGVIVDQGGTAIISVAGNALVGTVEDSAGTLTAFNWGDSNTGQTGYSFHLVGGFVVGTTGTWGIAWSQAVSSATATTMYNGSWLVVTQF